MRVEHVTQNQIEPTPGGSADITTRRPSIAGNANAPFPTRALGRFDERGLADAEWLRLPAPGHRCALSQLSRTTLNELIDRGEVRAITIRQPGATRGIKLLHRESLLGYLARLDAEQNGGVQ